jgi:hypothetical protein
MINLRNNIENIRVARVETEVVGPAQVNTGREGSLDNCYRLYLVWPNSITGKVKREVSRRGPTIVVTVPSCSRV